jgi:hypothetical protein
MNRDHERDQQRDTHLETHLETQLEAHREKHGSTRRAWLEMLLPGPAEAARREQAERLLDALANWVLPTTSPAQPIDLDAARALVRSADVEEAARLVEVVLAATAGAILPFDTCASWWKPAAVARPAWSRLAAIGSRHVDIPTAPAPSEAPTRVVRRLQAWLERHAPVVAETWSVRTTWALENAGAAFERWEQRYGRGTLGLRPFSQRVACLVDGVELCLDLGRPRAAHELLQRHPLEMAADGRLVQRLAWCAFAAGDEHAARAAWSEAPRERLVWPEPIAALRRRWPAALHLFDGRVPSGIEHSDLRPAPVSNGERHEIGALRLAFVAPRRGGGGFVVVHQEGVAGVLAAREAQRLVDPSGPTFTRLERALKSGAFQFEFAEDADDGGSDGVGDAAVDAAYSAGSSIDGARHDVAAHGRPARFAKGGRADARGASRSDGRSAPRHLPRVRASVALPLPADGPRGVLWIEFPHVLVPTDERLRVFTAAAVRRALPFFDVHQVDTDALAYVAEGPARNDATRVRFVGVDGLDPRRDPRRAFAEGLASELPEVWRARPWWVIGAGLDPLEDAALRAGRAPTIEVWGARSPGPSSLDVLRSEELARRFETVAAELNDDLAPQQALSPAARVRAVVPLTLGSRVAALLVVEAQRRGELSPAALHRIALQMRTRGAQAFWAEVSRRHALRFGEAVFGDAFALERPEQLVELARSPVVGLLGARGSGKALLARCLHLVGGDGPFVDFGLLRPPRWREQLEARLRGSGTVLVRHVDRADPRVQAEFVQRVEEHERSGTGARLVWTAGGDDLVHALRERVALELSPLAERRVHVPALARALFERAAWGVGTAPGGCAARLDDSALALLWRAPWHHGVHDLVRLVVEIATGRPRARHGASEVERAAQALGITLVERLDSRQPPRELLAAAIATTALPNGRANQRRAALYLGWDRDTLRLRLREAGLLDEARTVSNAAPSGDGEAGVSTESS